MGRDEENKNPAAGEINFLALNFFKTKVFKTLVSVQIIVSKCVRGKNLSFLKREPMLVPSCISSRYWLPRSARLLKNTDGFFSVAQINLDLLLFSLKARITGNFKIPSPTLSPVTYTRIFLGLSFI